MATSKGLEPSSTHVDSVVSSPDDPEAIKYYCAV